MLISCTQSCLRNAGLGKKPLPRSSSMSCWFPWKTLRDGLQLLEGAKKCPEEQVVGLRGLSQGRYAKQKKDQEEGYCQERCTKLTGQLFSEGAWGYTGCGTDRRQVGVLQSCSQGKQWWQNSIQLMGSLRRVECGVAGRCHKVILQNRALCCHSLYQAIAISCQLLKACPGSCCLPDDY